MPNRRTRLRLLCAALLLIVACAALYGGSRYLLQRNGIEQLQWQGLSLSASGLQLQHLSLRQRSTAGELSLQGEQLQLAWRGFGLRPPFWQQMQLQQLTLAWQPDSADQPAEHESAPLNLQQLTAPLALLPRSVVIQHLQATLPCARGRCTATGDLSLQHNEPQQLALRLNLDHQQQRITGSLELQGDDDSLAATLTLAVDEQPQAKLRSRLQQQADRLDWNGQFEASALSQARAVQDWLSDWALPPGASWPQAPGEVALTADWNLSLPNHDLQLNTLLAATGDFELRGNLPQPWPIPALGQLQGQLALAAQNDGQHWLASRVEADLNLTQPSGEWLEQLPPALRSDSLHLRLQPDTTLGDLRDDLHERSLPLQLTLALRGATRLDLQGRLALASSAPWAVQFADTRLTTGSGRLEQAGWQARDLRSELLVSGQADASGVQLAFAPGSRVLAASLQGAPLKVQQTTANLGGSRIALQLQDGALQHWQFSGPLTLAAARLEQANLKPQGWRWQGQVTASAQTSNARGKLSNDSDLQLDLDAGLDSQQNLQLEATLGELFLRSGNPLAKSLMQWPELLDLNNGRLNASAKLSLAAGSGTPKLDLQLNGKGLGGIYDRAELSGLDTRLQFKLAAQRFELDIQQLQLQQANPGLPIGPIEARGHYRAPLAEPARGQLQLSQAHSALMGGRVTLAPGQWDLATGSQLFPITLSGLELQQLFTLYPAEGLAGSGTLDGQVPLRWGSNGIEVDNGHIAARPPGGRLQFHSEKIRALGRSNPAMQLVTQSLEDFNFTTLSSSVDYDQHGKLNLGMRLEGQNPAIENGRPIHFNINLEEDIPKLLTSLQLTDRVNDIITRRVQQRVLQQRSETPTEP